MFSILNEKLADIGFFINLDSSTDRLSNVESQINNFNINDLIRFPATTDPLHQSSATKSHLNVFKKALQNNCKTIFVAEDDFQLYSTLNIGNLTTNLEEYIPILSNDLSTISWDVILLGGNPKKPCIPVTKHFSKLFKSTGAWGYLIKKNAMDYILSNFEYGRDRMAIDDILPALTYRGFSVYISNVQIIHHAHGYISTLQPSLGPIDYRQWILGNYYNHLWYAIKDYNSFDNTLDQIYNNTNFSRNNIIVLNNYTTINQLYKFLETHSEYKHCYIQVNDTQDRHLQYCISAEFNNLIHCKHHANNILGLGSNEIHYSL